MGTSNYPVSSIETTFRVIEALTQLGEGGITEIAANAGVSNSTAHKHLNTLRSLGYVRKDDTTYALNLRFLGLGIRARSQYDLVRVAKPFVDELHTTTGTTTSLVVLEDRRGVYAYRSPDSVKIDGVLPAVGESVYLQTTAAGKAILSELKWEAVRDLIDDVGPPEAIGSSTSSRPEHESPSQSAQSRSETRRGRTIFQLRQEIRSIQSRGYAFETDEQDSSIQHVATPITTGTGPVGAISISSDSEHPSDTNFEDEVADSVISTTEEIEAELLQE